MCTKFSVVTYLLICDLTAGINGFRVFDVNNVQTILALEDEKVNIVCKTDMPISYCGFIHSSGKRYSFTGNSLSNGQCVLGIVASNQVSGEWRCHLGTRSTGLEEKQLINLRVVGEVAALQPKINTIHGKEIILNCVTTQTLKPLSYCRFEPPNGVPFSIDSSVTRTNPILGQYFFPANKSLDRGDCAVTIRKVKYEDVGLWTCGAGLDDGKEHIDDITVDVEGLYTMSTASATGITFGVLGIFVGLLLLGMYAWKRGHFPGIRRRREQEEPGIEIRDLGAIHRPVNLPEQGPVPSLVIRSPSSSPRASSPFIQE